MEAFRLQMNEVSLARVEVEYQRLDQHRTRFESERGEQEN